MSFWNSIVSLLTAALSLIGLVHANPTLPPATQNQVVQVAQQAVTQATDAIASQQNTETSQNATAESSNALTVTPSSGAAPLTVTFNGTISTTNPSSSGGLGVDEPWIDFGDEQEGDAPSSGEVFCPTPYDLTNYVYPTSCAFSSISHTYTLPGTYTAVLHLGTQKGPDIILGTTTIVVTGNGPAFQKSLVSPNALTATPSSGTTGQPITFSTSFGGQNTGTAYFVDFGDNSLGWFLCGQTLPGEQANESCLPSAFQHTYSGSGTYTVLLHKYTGSFNESPAVGSANVTISGSNTLPPPTCTLTASPNPATVGQEITVSWTTQNANNEGPAGYGAWMGGTGSGDLFESSDVLTQMKAPAALSGSQTINADKTGTDTLTLGINGPGGSGEGSCSVQLTVNQ